MKELVIFYSKILFITTAFIQSGKDDVPTYLLLLEVNLNYQIFTNLYEFLVMNYEEINTKIM